MAFVVGDDSRDTRRDTSSQELDALRTDHDKADRSADLDSASLDMSDAGERAVRVTSRPVSDGAAIFAGLNAVMAAFGFATAQVGSDSDGSVAAIFCANNNVLLAAHPGLPVPVYRDVGACTDFTVETSAVPEARVVEARLEGEGIDRLVVAMGRSDLLPAALAVRGMPLEEALSEVGVLVREVFAAAARR